MRALLAVVAAILLGAALGGATAMVRVNWRPWDGDPGGDGTYLKPLTSPESAEPGTHAEPKVVVAETKFDFGKMNVDGEGSHDFVFSNRGTVELLLDVGSTTCRCTVAELKATKIPPGGSAPVKLTWTPSGTIGRYEQTATILTSDPETPRVTLTVTGLVTVAVRAVPSAVNLGRLSAGEPTTATVPVFCYLDEPALELLGHTLSSRRHAENFEIEFLPLPPERLDEEPEARSGQLLRITVKPGLPLGTFERTILIRTNLESASAVELLIRGTVGREITVVGPGWDEFRGVLEIGEVDSRKGDQRRLWLFARGPDQAQVRFRHVRSVPEWLQVEIGEKKQINATSSQVPLLVRIPPGSRQASFLGSKQGKLGRIVLETNHPRVPKLEIPVRFAVKD